MVGANVYSALSVRQYPNVNQFIVTRYVSFSFRSFRHLKASNPSMCFRSKGIIGEPTSSVLS